MQVLALATKKTILVFTPTTTKAAVLEQLEMVHNKSVALEQALVALVSAMKTMVHLLVNWVNSAMPLTMKVTDLELPLGLLALVM